MTITKVLYFKNGVITIKTTQHKIISAIARLTSNARRISSMYKSHKMLAIITIIVK